MINNLRNWVASFVLTVVSVFVSYEWIDRALAFFVHDHSSQHEIFVWLQHIAKAFPLLAVLAFVLLGFLALTKHHLSKFQVTMFLCSLSLVVADAVTDRLKFIFGRTWPETWMGSNPSLINDGVYGFNPFHGGFGFASFPSGHVTVICAVMSVLWIHYPRFWLFYVLCIAAVVVGAIGANYHFLSDAIAGGFIGASTGWVATAIWRATKSDS
jgi:membrane-associated phospholipid phosphatase